MNSTPRPQHASYRVHRRQVAWQIIVPIVLAALILIVVTYLLTLSTFRDNGDVARWAEISTMWLTIPVIIGGLFMLVIVGGLAYLMGRLVGLIPPYSHQAQLMASKMEAGAHRVGEMGHRPTLIIPELGKLIRAAVRKARGG